MKGLSYLVKASADFLATKAKATGLVYGGPDEAKDENEADS